MLVHTFYGYTARAVRPAWVKPSVGPYALRWSSQRSSCWISLAVYGQSGNFNLAG